MFFYGIGFLFNCYMYWKYSYMYLVILRNYYNIYYESFRNKIYFIKQLKDKNNINIY